MAGISSKALNNAVENKYRFNGGNELQSKEFSDGSGLDWYDANFRGYDPQIGRFMQIDPLAEATDNISPYVFGYNNPVIINDPLGLLGDTTVNGVHYDDAKTLSEVVIILHGNNNSNSNASGTTSSAGFVEFDTGRNPFGNYSEAGALPLPYYQPPLFPVPPPGEVIPLFNPSPAINPWILRGTGTVGLVLSPLSAGRGSDFSHHPTMNPFARFKPYPGHGNNRDNSNPHIVYQFSFTPPSGDTRTPILKYGISDEYRYGLERPENQLARFVAMYGTTVALRILARTINRETALAIEQDKVNVHWQTWGEMPREQIKPAPSNR
jgi:RHS repeat-associated protein